MLEAEPLVVILVAPWLALHDLWSLRSVSRACFAQLPLHTSRLVAEQIGNTATIPSVVRYFPHARDVALQQVTLPIGDLNASLAHLQQWQITHLELSQVWSLTDESVWLVTEYCSPTLERLVLRQNFLLKTPAIRGGARLKHVTIESCLVTSLSDDTTWPALEELCLASRVLDTLHARHLLQHQLAQTRVRVLDLSDCFMIEQLLIDPGELPWLQTLTLRSSLAIKRIHVASPSLQVVDLSLCGALEIAVLDLAHVKRLDLSYLQRLTHLFIRSQSLGLLNLRACSQLRPANMKMECPAVVSVHLQGTTLRLEDLAPSESSVHT